MATKHFSHDHPLTQWHMKEKDEELKCYGCDIPVEGPVYGCKDCKFHLHKSCAELPEEFQHPYHRDHPLVLRLAWREHFCHFCCSPICGFNLCCDDCDFYLDARCASVYSNQQFAARMWEDGGHVFCLKKTEPKTMYPCDACNNFDDDTYLYECALPACPRIIHFRCAPFPLPESIKHKRHLHALNLTPSYVEDDSGEYYCDSCEKYRNENHPVYLCIPCDYVAHVSCAIFEVSFYIASIILFFQTNWHKLIIDATRVLINFRSTTNQFESLSKLDLAANYVY